MTRLEALRDLVRGTYLRHEKGGLYRVLYLGKVQFGGVWSDAVVYRNADGQVFVRSLDDMAKMTVEYHSMLKSLLSWILSGFNHLPDPLAVDYAKRKKEAMWAEALEAPCGDPVEHYDWTYNHGWPCPLCAAVHKESGK